MSCGALINFLDLNPSLNQNFQVISGMEVDNCHALSKKRVVEIGLKDLILVETENTTLILHKGKAQMIKELSKILN